MQKIAPSILSADFSKLGEEIKRMEKSGADYIHIDVMDGHFVPNITIGPPVVRSIRNSTGLIFDVHLMIEDPDKYIDDFMDAGADIITVHAEASKHLHRTIQKIKQHGKKAGVSLNPATPISSILHILNDIDIVLIMTVNPGFSGQTFIESLVEKISEAKKIIKEKKLKVDIEVDGGIDLHNVGIVAKAGANIIVSGSTIFNAVDAAQVIESFRETMNKCTAL